MVATKHQQGVGTLVFYVNGKKIVEDKPDPEHTLLSYLRNNLVLTGTKQGCGEGGCGACTIMVSRVDRSSKQIIHYAVNACLAPLCAMHGLAITTVEGIGSSKTRLHPIQERLFAAHGSQCGFCTPGFVMSMYALLRSNPQPSRHLVDEAFQGNLCRCTGYRPIMEGMKTFTKEFQCGMGDQCCRNKPNSTPPQVNGLPNGAMANGALPNGALPNGALPNGALPNGALPNGALPTGAMPNGALPNAALSNGALPNGALPNGALPNGALPTGALPNGALPNGALPNGALPTGSLPNGALPNGALPNGALPNGALPNGALPNGALPNGALPNGALPNGALPNGALPNGALPNGALPKGALPNGALPNGALPNGALPNGALPNGALPNGALPNGALPNGALPNGALPNGALPNGALPNGALPNGALPNGALPNGALPNGALPNGALPKGALPNGVQSKGYGAINGGLTKTKDPSQETKVLGSMNADLKKLTAPYDPSQEPIFPPELQLTDEYDKERKVFVGASVTWYRPVQLAELLDIVHKHPKAKLINGNTEVGIEMKLKQADYPVLVCVTNIEELLEVTSSSEGLYVGASCTLGRLETVLRAAVEEQPEYQTRVFAAIIEMLKWFAGPQIRNVAALGGNIMTASPISDINPLLMAAGAKLKIASKGVESRWVQHDDSFFTGYRRTKLTPGELLQGVLIPYTQQNEYFYGFKQSRRREDDIAIVNAGMKVKFESGSDIIEEVVLSYGGMAATTVLAKTTMAALKGKRWEEGLVEEACSLLQKDMTLPPGVPGGMEAYRMALCSSFFFKFYLSVKQQLCSNATLGSKVDQEGGNSCEDLSAISGGTNTPSSGSQVFEMNPDETPHPVGKPIPHLSGIKHTTGEAVYVDDMPKYRDELYLGFVLSTKAHAYIRNVDTSEALSMPGVVAYVDHTDVPAVNSTGKQDGEIFASEKVLSSGKVIGAIVAESVLLARKAAHKVKVTYEELEPIVSIDEAIECNSFFEDEGTILSGDVSAGLAASDNILSGEVRIGGQEHFYLETQASLVVPRGEDRDVEIYSSCQNPSGAQKLVAETLGVGTHRVTIRVKRMGGAFGGKETSFSLVMLPAVVAAVKLGRPIRCMLDRDQDMLMTGTRHPFLSKYKVGFTSEGLLQGLDIELFGNAGSSLGASWAVLQTAMKNADNSYKVPCMRVHGRLCKTNTPSNTAFRGFGSPQSMFMIESILQHIAEHLGKDPCTVRGLNLYHEGDRTPYRMVLENTNIRRCWADVMDQSDYVNRRQNATEFNRKNKWRKRGIIAVPTKYGIGFTKPSKNKAVALVNVYTDGTVLVAHSGTEMGQGLHTKMLQVASRVLDIPTSKVFINETSTAATPNMSSSGGSTCSDLNGMAVMYACEILEERLAPYKKAAPHDSWEDWVSCAYNDRVNLSAVGFYKMPGLTAINWKKPVGGYDTRPYSYFTCGAAVTEVEIDCLTGDHVVLRTDIVMDIGQSLNQAIDVGQIEGAFVQGYGLFTLEELVYSPDGHSFTRGPGAYKIPGLGDIPQQLNVTLLKGTSNPKAVYSSKGIGELPLFLAASVFFAIKDAVLAARKASGTFGDFRMDSPATAERIRMACVDKFTKQIPVPEPGTYKPWTVPL